uniref:LD20239p n=1 Tax=Drosophila melanogaster TaxID=7227 RepID=Q7JR73_DROME|eukprot:NP_001163217.1 reduction in Cnn dots 6, isoform B [Drosophila melanogaster]
MNYQKASEKQSSSSLKKRPPGNGNSIQNFWNDRIMERFIKANLFIICCVVAVLLLIVYLGAFSCEVSWILEAHGELPFAAYTLCSLYFVMFVATTILIHGLVSGLCWPLFAWSGIIGLLSIPELVFVMIMTTQHWGLQSVHGLTELTSYLIRLIINCFALICVIPTGIRWRRETQVLSQLQGLATRLSLQTPAPSVPITKADSRRSSQRLSGFENAGYQLCDETASKLPLGPGMGLGMNNQCGGSQAFGSQNEFNASMFAPALAQQFNNATLMQRGGTGGAGGGHRAQSLMDLRCTLPGMYNPRHVLDTEDKNAKYFNITIDDLKNNLHDSHRPSPPSLIGSTSNDPIYCSIEPKQLTPPPAQQRSHHRPRGTHKQPPPGKLSRNCVSLENLDGISKVQNDLTAYGNNLLQNYTQQQQYYLAMLLHQQQQQQLHHQQAGGIYRRPSNCSSTGGFAGTVLAQPMQRRGSTHSQQMQYYGGFGYANYTNPYITANSKLSLGNESDDYRKYRDVAL